MPTSYWCLRVLYTRNFPRSYRPIFPAPNPSEHFRPDLIFTSFCWFGPKFVQNPRGFQVQISSETGQNRVLIRFWGEVFGGGQGERVGEMALQGFGKFYPIHFTMKIAHEFRIFPECFVRIPHLFFGKGDHRNFTKQPWQLWVQNQKADPQQSCAKFFSRAGQVALWTGDPSRRLQHSLGLKSQE